MNKLMLMAMMVMMMTSSSGMSWTRMIGLGILMAGGFVFMLYKNQENMLYQPKIYSTFVIPAQNPVGYQHPMEHDMPYEDVYLTTPDGLKLHAWFIHGKSDKLTKERPTFLFFHANAGNMGFRLPNLKHIYDHLKVNIFILSYRGYGESQGEPNEEGLKLDAECAFDHVKNQMNHIIDPNKIIIFGRSLGGAVTNHLMGTLAEQDRQDEVAAVILENTFTSISDMVDQLFPVLRPIKKWVLKLNWPSIDSIKLVDRPILFLSGLQDEVVPPVQMEKLHDAAVLSDRTMARFPAGHHNDTWLEGGPDYTKVLSEFVKANTGYDPDDHTNEDSVFIEEVDDEEDYEFVDEKKLFKHSSSSGAHIEEIDDDDHNNNNNNNDDDDDNDNDDDDDNDNDSDQEQTIRQRGVGSPTDELD